MLKYKYNTTCPNFFNTRVVLGSPFMKSLSWALAAAKNFYRWVPRDGKIIAFWHDIWIGDCSLKTAFWNLFDICQQQDATIAQVWDCNTIQLTFRRCVDARTVSRLAGKKKLCQMIRTNPCGC